MTAQYHVHNYITRIQTLLAEHSKDGVDCHTANTEYGGGNAQEVESAMLLNSLVMRYDPAVILESGTHWGWSSSWLATGLAWLEESYPKNRRLLTIDVNDYDQRGERLWARLSVSHFVQRFIGDARDEETIARVKASLSGPVDFFLCDADHSAISVVQEWNLIAPLLNRKRACVVWHDTRLDKREAVGVKWIMDALKGANDSGYDIYRPDYAHVGLLPLRNMRGIDVLLLTNEPLLYDEIT